MTNKTRPIDFLIFLGLAIVVVAGVSVGGAIWFRAGAPTKIDNGLRPGDTAPIIQAQGWINGETPADGFFDGKVIVLDTWRLE